MDSFIGEIRVFGFNFAPNEWAFCNGATMSIQQNSALFAILRINFGGNGTTTFMLPNLQGAVPMGQGQGPGLTDRVVGETAGEANVTLLTSNLPSHGHTLSAETLPQAAQTNANMTAAPAAGSWLSHLVHLTPAPKQTLFSFSTVATPATTLAPQAVGLAGGSKAVHSNLQPYLTMNYCISLAGVFPARS